MEDQKRPNVVSNIWNNWCNLDPIQRNQVAERLGPLGHMLSIAANVHMFAQHGSEALVTANTDAVKKPNVSDVEEGADADDVIDAEFEEVGP